MMPIKPHNALNKSFFCSNVVNTHIWGRLEMAYTLKQYAPFYTVLDNQWHIILNTNWTSIASPFTYESFRWLWLNIAQIWRAEVSSSIPPAFHHTLSWHLLKCHHSANKTINLLDIYQRKYQQITPIFSPKDETEQENNICFIRMRKTQVPK